MLGTLQHEVLSKMKDGVPARDVYNHALSYIKEKKPDLEKHFVKSIGFGVRNFQSSKNIFQTHFFQMGLEFRDSSYLLNAKNTRILKSSMVFNLALGFQNLIDGEGQK